MAADQAGQVRGVFRVAMMALALIAAALALTTAPTAAQGFADYRIGPHDVIQISVFGRDELLTQTRVSADGTVLAPLVGKVSVQGLSAQEAAEAIGERMVRAGVVRANATRVDIVTFGSRQVSVLGAVGSPGLLALDREYTLSEILARVGGATAGASEELILRRRGPNGSVREDRYDIRALLEEGGSGLDIALQGGETIYVPPADFFYVYGSSNSPGVYQLRKGLTVQQGLAMSGGIADDGTDRGLTALRVGEDGRVRTVDIGMTDQIQPDDVIIVRERIF